MKLRFDTLEGFDEWLADGMHIDWQVAHDADDDWTWKHRWGNLPRTLDGLLLAIIYLLEWNEAEYEYMRESVRLLGDVARQHAIDGYEERKAA